MKEWLEGRWSARFLLVLSFIACACIWVPTWWKTICAVYQFGNSGFLASFFRVVFTFALCPVILAVLSFPFAKRFPALFRGRSVLLGGIYSALGSACLFCIFLGCILSRKRYPVQMDAAAVIFVVSMAILGIVLLLDGYKLRPSGREFGARFLVCTAYVPSIFLSYMVVWDWLCELADHLK